MVGFLYSNGCVFREGRCCVFRDLRTRFFVYLFFLECLLYVKYWGDFKGSGRGFRFRLILVMVSFILFIFIFLRFINKFEIRGYFFF